MRPWLSPGGTASALAIGTAVWAGTGWRGFVPLLVFLAGSSLLTPGGGRRRPAQVFANGGVAAGCALLAGLHPAFVVAFAGAVAAAAADTWSTEIGGRSATPPRLITSGAKVAPGTSGGITVRGTSGGLLGAAVIAATAWATGLTDARGAAIVTLAGVSGMLLDSLLGATLQAYWRCVRCGQVSESPSCTCGGRGARASGIGWLNNDAVNAAATLAGAIAASIPAFLRSGPLP